MRTYIITQCTHCGAEIEREKREGNFCCFDCKKKRSNKTSAKARKRNKLLTK